MSAEGTPVPRGSPPDRLVVGRVVRPHGIGGELLVERLTDAEDRFVGGARLDLGDPGDLAALRPVEIVASRSHQGRLLLRLQGVDDRDAADEIRNTLLSIPGAAARDLADDEFWPHQLIGLAVTEPDGRRRGQVEDVIPGAAHDLLAVLTDEGNRVLVPAVAALVTVELEAGRVLVEPLPGLLDPDRS